MSRLRRGSLALTSVLALAAGTLAIQPTAQAQTRNQTQNQTPPQQPFALKGVGKGPHTVTLITGDRITLTDVGAGRYEISQQGGARPDGRVASLFVRTGPDGVYALPDDAFPAIQSGLLDRELFNVKYLAENGYTDAQTKNLPVIVQYPKGFAAARTSADAMPASAPTATLESINGAALDVTKGEAGAFWAALHAAPDAKGTARLQGGVAKVWLDRKVKADLAESVPQIGAPEAWKAGHDGAGVSVAVLDTGIDAAHPDLAGKITEARSFIPDETVKDGHGHGTHVATTIAGSGAASNGANKGVAPGARLLVGKVLDDGGSGAESGIIEAMEWATAAGAKVVSMSLGANATDGTDPMSQAVNDLSAATGALFVIAAGNNGGQETVGTPGTADAALTVGAVDKSGKQADFASQGPRVGDGALKPDITAPGVDIAAGRAAGTAMGSPVDEHYTKASGTSMATPHVAGAAAIVAQAHPDWTGQQLKAALMSTAKDTGGTVYERGAGLVDAGRAATQRVFAVTPSLDFRLIDATGKPQTRELTYTNLGDQPVTLALKPAMDGLSVADASLTVPAKGTATTTVTLKTEGLPIGLYGGAVTAEADGLRLTTPVGAVRDVPTVELTIRTLGRDGKPITPFAQDVIDLDGRKGQLGPHLIVDHGVVVTRVPVGTISVLQIVEWVDADSKRNRAWLFEPELTVTGDTEITLDVRKTTQVRFSTPKPAEPLNNGYNTFYQRTNAKGQVFSGALVNGVPTGSWGKLWVSPTEKVTKGGFRFSTQWTLGRAEVAMSVLGRRGATKLDPAVNLHWQGQVDSHPDWKPFTGTADLKLADVGQGSPEELAGRDLRGKLVLMGAEGVHDPFGNPVCGAQIERIGAVRDAGAAGLLIYPLAETGCAVPLPMWQKPFSGPPKPIGIPNAHLSTKEGLALREQAGRGPVTIRVEGHRYSPYTYALTPYEEGRIPDSLHYTVRERDTARVDLAIRAPRSTGFWEWTYAFKVDDATRWGISPSESDLVGEGPQVRPEYVWPTDPTVAHLRGMALDPTGTQGVNARYLTEVHPRPGRTGQVWFAPGTPGAATVGDAAAALPDPKAGVLEQQPLGLTCAICVQGDKLWADFSEVSGVGATRVDGDAYWSVAQPFTPNYETHLYRDGKEIAREGVEPVAGNAPRFTLPATEGVYRLTAKNAVHDVEWTFTGPPAAGAVQPGAACNSWFIEGTGEHCRPTPAVFVSYALGGEADNSVAAGRRHTFEVEAYHSRSTAPMPKIAGLKVWASTDDGATWQPVTLKRERDGRYTASVRYPALRATTGAVSLRAEAWDAAGNRVKQTSTRILPLR
ncbi:S8 family serine peptidase [Nonomuraea sp. NPDC050310]|uniref:S8 family serine peptidase n=1 Tax=Nonomuraea sp. NPDC050310 TaxID=3154935 RepID=UPI0033DC06F2